jgi:oligopeptide/dipeptide ABC transporter ATP-binding protein
MYAGKIAESAPVRELYANPLHPYTQGLFRSLPRLSEVKDRLDTIPGVVPDPLDLPTGCKFHPRCPLVRDDPQCKSEEPALRQCRPGHFAACWKAPGYNAANESEDD